MSGIDPNLSAYQNITLGSRRRRTQSPYDANGRMVPPGGYDPNAGNQMSLAQGTGNPLDEYRRITMGSAAFTPPPVQGYNPNAGNQMATAQGTNDPYAEYRRIALGGASRNVAPTNPLDEYRRITMGSGGQVPPPPPPNPLDEYRRITMGSGAGGYNPNAGREMEEAQGTGGLPPRDPRSDPVYGHPIDLPRDPRSDPIYGHPIFPPGTPPVSKPPPPTLPSMGEPRFDPYESYFDLIDRIEQGSLVAEADLAGLPPELADRVRGYQDLVSGLDVSKPANLEDRLYSQSMQGIMNPQPYGMGATDLALGREAASGIEQQIADMTSQLNVTAQGEKDTIARHYQQQREQLARMYAIDPSGRMSGQAQRDFEVLGAQEADALSAVDARVRDEVRQNIGVLTGLQESREGAALNATQMQLQQRQAAAGFLGQQQQQELAQRQQQLATRGQLFSEETGRAELTGQLGDQQTLAAQQLGLARGELVGELGGQQTLAARQLAEQARQADNELAFQQGTAIGQVGGDRTLAARAADLQEQAFFADQLGYIHDPNSPTGFTETLTGKAQRFDQEFQSEQFSESVRQFNTSFLGELIDPLTGQVREGLDAERVRAGITQANQQLDLAQRELQLQVGKTWADITGTTGVPGPISAQDFGFDPSQFQAVPREALPYTAEGDQIRQSLRAMSGQEPTDDEIARIMTGDTIEVMGAPTLEARRLGAEIMRSNLDRAVEYQRISQSTGIEWARLNQAIDESDRQWALQTADVATRNDLDAEKFRLAKWEIEHQAAINQEQLQLQTTETANRFGLDVARFNQAITEFNTQATLQAETAQAQIADLANRYGLDAAKFNQGIDEFNAQIEIQRQQTQAQIADTANRYNLDAAQFQQAINEFDATYGLQREQTLAQTADIANRFGLDSAKFNQAINEFGMQFELQQQSAQAQAADIANRYGLDVAKFNDASNQFAAQNVLAQQQSQAQIADLANRYGLDQSKFDQAVNEFNAQFGLQAYQAQANVADVANRYGLDSAKFAEAVSEFDQQYALQERQVLQQLGITEEQWNQANGQVKAQEQKEKLLWDSMLRGEKRQMNLQVDDQTRSKVKYYMSSAPPNETPEQALARLRKDPDLSALYDRYAASTGNTEMLSPQQLNAIANDDIVQFYGLPSDWLSEMSADQRNSLLSLLDKGQVTAGQKAGPGFWGAVGQFAGIAVGALAGNPALGAAMGGGAGGLVDVTRKD